MSLSMYQPPKSSIAAAAVALLVIQNKGAKKVVLAGILELTEPLVCAPVERSVTRQPIELQFWEQYIISSKRSVVLTGKLAPRLVTVGAVPVILFTKFQFPVFAFMAIPILPGVVFVVGSTLVGATIESAIPTKARLPATRVLIPNLVVKKKPPKPAALPLQFCRTFCF